MTTEQFPSGVDLNALDGILAAFPDPSGSLIALLQAVQSAYGYLPQNALSAIAQKTGIPEARIWGVATFYAQFKLQRPGKYQISVCLGTACHVNGGGAVAQAIAEALGVPNGHTTPDGLFSWEQVACLGCCSLSPVMMINGTAYGSLTREKALAVLDDIRKKEAGA